MRSLLHSQRKGISGKASAGERKQIKKIHAPARRKERVLVMDDDPFVRSLIRCLLRDSGYDARAAKTGDEAVEYFKAAGALGAPFDAVVLDLHVPSGMGGDKVLEKLREVDPGVKAILLTADISHPVVSNYEALGFKSAIIKPFNNIDLQRALDLAFGKDPDGPEESPAQ